MNKFLYLHIPKTGGVAFRSVIEDASHARRILHVTVPGELAAYSQKELEGYDLIHGHLNINQVSKAGSHKKIVTLRDPIARCISTYSFWRGLDPEQGLWGERGASCIRSARTFGIKELMATDEFFIKKHFNNLQTRLLCGARDWEMSLGVDHLRRAIENLKRVDFYGINSRLDESIDLFCFKFGVFRPKQVQKLNASHHSEKADDEVIRILQDLNHLDLELLEWAEKNHTHQ